MGYLGQLYLDQFSMEELQAMTAQEDQKKKGVTIKVTNPSTTSTIKNQDSVKEKVPIQPTRKWIMNQMRNAREVTKEGHRWTVPIGNDMSLRLLITKTGTYV